MQQGYNYVKGVFPTCSVVRRIAQYVADILEPEDKDKLYENLLVGQNKVGPGTCTACDIFAFLTLCSILWRTMCPDFSGTLQSSP